jgi:hypothetical protein
MVFIDFLGASRAFRYKSSFPIGFASLHSGLFATIRGAGIRVS